jgi:hypothetical protein
LANPFWTQSVSIKHEVNVPTNNISEYIIRVVVELPVEGQAEQHREQAALPKQQAICRIKI